MIAFLPAIVVALAYFDTRNSSYIIIESGPHFAWLYAVPIFLILYSLIFYSYTYRGGRLPNSISRKMSKTAFGGVLILGGIASSLFFAFLAFDLTMWAASYSPGAPVLTRELAIIEIRRGIRGRVMAIASTETGETVRVRVGKDGRSAFRIGAVVLVQCKDAKTRCRIVDIEKL